uniref:Uncharacterized protein n=1 Tax=Amphimedon queenslandica TaxID=400682 RepID=A0A1X7T461_AMPQE
MRIKITMTANKITNKNERVKVDLEDRWE